MTRAYSVKGKKRKTKEVVVREEDEEQQIQPKKPFLQSEEPTPTIPEKDKSAGISVDKPMLQNEEPTSTSTITELNELDGIPIAPSIDIKNSEKPGVIFILEKASLEIAKVGKTYQLLNSDDHANFLLKGKKNPGNYRPDITHQALLSILDSPLNKAGRLKAVYIKTEKGDLIEVKPYVRLPRTFKRFAGIMVELLQKLSISAAGKRDKLLRMVKNPVTQYLPIDARKVGFSCSSEKLVHMKDYVSTIPCNVDLVFVVGAMAHGKVEQDHLLVTDDSSHSYGWLVKPKTVPKCDLYSL
uniref:Ribosomal RNA small subunit methyltransferase NEP1-like isoform X2 n=1 Tax=Cicer arietinum TaxID=3827 RepID=A0A3Q7YCV5_CICAR|nr:ribosomal RNA small subunit methyltransferase NEP1-like isoform X2 [Cicer arietinum]